MSSSTNVRWTSSDQELELMWISFTKTRLRSPFMRTLNSKIDNTKKAGFELEKYLGMELNGLDIFIFSTLTFIHLLLIFLRYHIMLCGLS